MLSGAPGTCKLCAVKHGDNEPHNAQSLPYQVLFRSRHGRDATWADAIAHCDDEMKKMWKEALVGRGAWTEPKSGDPIPEPFTAGDGKPIPLPGLEPVTVPMQGRKKK